MAPRRRIRRQASSPSAKEGKPNARRPSPVGHRVDPEPALGDHPEGALAAHEQLGEVGPGGRPGPVPAGADHPAVGQHHLEADDHVLDLPVAVGVLAGTPAGQPAAHGRQVHRLGPVAEGDAVAVAQRRLHVGPEGAGPEVGHQRVGVDVGRCRPGRRGRGRRRRTGGPRPRTPRCGHRPGSPGPGPGRRGRARRPPGRCRWAGPPPPGGPGPARRRPIRWPAATSPGRPRPVTSSSSTTAQTSASRRRRPSSTADPVAVQAVGRPGRGRRRWG